MIDSFDDIDSVGSLDNAEYVDNADAVPPPFTFHPTSNPIIALHSKTTVSVLTHTSILPASRGY